MYKAVLGAICCLSFALSLHAQSPQEKGLQSISRTSAKAIVGFLADDELQGREAGMHGSRVAARYTTGCPLSGILPERSRHCPAGKGQLLPALRGLQQGTPTTGTVASASRLHRHP